MANFEKATRLNFTFDSPKGVLQVQDLWNLPLTSGTGKACLEDIAQGLNQQLKESNETSFFSKPPSAGIEVVQEKLEIVKHIGAVRIAENEKAATARVNAEKKQKILEIIARKQDDSLAGASLEELQKMAADL